MSGYKNVAFTIRNMVAREVEQDAAALRDDYRWLDQLIDYPEEIECLLYSIQEKFAGRAIFRPLLTDADLEAIATVGALVAHVKQQLSRMNLLDPAEPQRHGQHPAPKT